MSGLQETREREQEEHKSTRLVRYLSDQGDEWHSYTNDQEFFVQDFPKIELHVHLDGSVDPDFLWSYMKRNPDVVHCLPIASDLPWEPDRQLPVRALVQRCETSADFHKLCTCRGYRSLKAMLGCFQIFLPVIRRNLQLLEQLAFDFCQRQWEQNAVYTEVRYSPHLLADDFQLSNQLLQQTNDNYQEVDAEMVLHAVTRGLRRGCAKFDITVNQILCAITWRPDWALASLELVRKYRDAYPCATVGIDIAAGEEHFDRELYPHLYKPHYEMIQQAQADGIPITLHAGESTDQAMDNVRRSIVEYAASRIGHGYRMVQSRELMTLVKEHNVHVEVCPTSSYETGGWITEDKNWKNHPCIEMKNRGIPFSLSSDDPAVFHTSLAWQYRLALAKMDFTREDLLDSNLAAINAAFCSEDEKQRLRGLIYSFGSHFRLRSNLSDSSHNGRSTKGTQDSSSSSSRTWQRSLSDNFADRVYISHSFKV